MLLPTEGASPAQPIGKALPEAWTFAPFLGLLRDLEFFGGLVKKAKEMPSKGISEPYDDQRKVLEALQRAWYYLFEIILAVCSAALSDW